MKIKFFIIFVILIIASTVFADKIFGQEATGLTNIRYPVEELGNCKSKTDCKTYCDEPKNANICLDFARKNNLMTENEIAVAKKFTKKEIKGPGGCSTKDSCEEYCNNISHINECISFAEENNLIPPEELEEAKKVQAAIARGAKPPPCGNKKSCDVYCDDPEHMEECITFGIEAGFIQGKELEDVQKMLQAVKRGVKPPPCKGKEACDKYCSEPDNMEMCMTFAMEAGFMSEQEKADSQKMLQALKKGVKPPNCRGKEECDVYCQQDEHFEECTNFAVAAGFINEKDAEMVRKTGGKGPGGCKGKEECDAFCNNPDNQETCFNFAKEHGMIPEEDLKRMEEGKQQMKQTFEQMPSEVEECLNLAIGADMVEKMKNGFMPPKEMGDTMRTCFEKMGPPLQEPGEPGGPGQGGMMRPGQTGPGGCQTPEECQEYCENNPEECQKFQPGPGIINPGEQMMPQQAGPGGCKTPDECKLFCEANPDQCKNFQPPESQTIPQQPCEGENCQYGPPQTQMPPCEGENCQPPPQGQPCEGENCQYGPGPGTQPCQGENCQPPAGENFQLPPLFNDQMPPSDQQQPPPTDSGAGGNLAPGEPVPLAPPTEPTPPAEPAPSSFLINPDSLVASAVRALINFILHR